MVSGGKLVVVWMVAGNAEAGPDGKARSSGVDV
jgi:hypothetical protein